MIDSRNARNTGIRKLRAITITPKMARIARISMGMDPGLRRGRGLGAAGSAVSEAGISRERVRWPAVASDVTPSAGETRIALPIA
ncbi:hypothetical protein GCM10011392_22320 [Wenxinia marina]|nr:hypothetical protein GCM10011392_22320 [Wenxinia marina]